MLVGMCKTPTPDWRSDYKFFNQKHYTNCSAPISNKHLTLLDSHLVSHATILNCFKTHTSNYFIINGGKPAPYYTYV